MLVYIPAQIAVAAGVYNVLAGAPRFLGGILIFSASVWLMRVLVSQFYFMEAVPLKTWIACAIIVAVAMAERVTG